MSAHQITIHEVKRLDFPVNIQKEILDKDHFKYYQVKKENVLLGYFISYENPFHLDHIYIYPLKDTFLKLNQVDTVEEIKKYFKKPLQVMIESTEDETIKILNEVGFVLKRKSFERTFRVIDLKPFKENHPMTMDLFQRNSKTFDQACFMAFEYYKKTHQNISPLTKILEDFKEILPDQVLCHIKEDKILNLSFVDENELCYFTSSNEETFEHFSEQAIHYIFKKYETITFEVDSTDPIGLKFKSYFNDKSSESFNTYIHPMKLTDR